MTLTERYLNAVAAQLPRDQRADIIAELGDDIASRREAREAASGRPLNEAEEEALLREMGHPLAVAARFGTGPLHVVGPELYPWWLFAVKAGLIAIVVIVGLGALVRVLVGDVEVGQAIGQGFASAFNGAITLIGFATVAGFIFERQKEKPRFIREWRVKDLSLFEFGGALDADRVTRGLASGDWNGTGEQAPRRDRSRGRSPVANAITSAVFTGVALLWWVGWLPLTHTTPESLGAVVGGVDYGRILSDLHRLLYWPVIAAGIVRIAFDLMRAARPQAVRFTAAGDIGFGLVEGALYVWLWLASPLSGVIFVPTIEAFIDRVRQTLESGWWPLATILMLCVAFGFLGSVFRVIRATGRLITGQATD
ncbi:hypothetical protein GVN24_34725 [Rhizobium sp. CRIBSB]|nr:hypothetical protein [Rhizobium sp. CRIBSB]